MINVKALAALAFVTAIAVMLAVYSQRSTRYAPQEYGPFLPELMQRANDVSKIEVQSGDGAATLVKGDKEWGVKEKNDYPAPGAKVRSLVIGLAELQRVEPKTDNPELYAKIGLEDEIASGSDSVLVRLRDGNSDEIASVLIGKRKLIGGGESESQYYVRKLADPQAWLVEGKLPSARTPKDWIDTRILEIETKQIDSVSVTPADGEQLVIRRDNENAESFALVGLSEDEQVDSEYAVNNIARTIGALTADDVIPAEELILTAAPHRVAVETAGGSRIDLEFYEQGDEIYLRLSADAPSAEAGADPVAGEPTVLAERWRKWAYVVPKYQWEAISTKKSELVKTPTPPSDATPEPAN